MIRNAVLKLRSVLQSRVGALSSKGGRDRLVRVALSAGSQLVAKASSAVLMLVSIRWALPYLDEERLGTWISITSLIVGLTWVDLGIGNALITHLARAAARDDRSDCRHLFSSAVFLLMGVAAVALVVMVGMLFVVDVGWLLSLKSKVGSIEARDAVVVAVILFCLSVPVSLVERARLAFQESHITSWFMVGSGLLSVALLAVATHYRSPLPVLLAVVQGPPFLCALINGWVLLRRQRPWLIPALKEFRWEYGSLMLRTGSVFLALNLLQTANFQLDTFVIGKLLGQSSVSQFSYHQRPFAIIQSIQLLCIVPLWPAYAEAITLGEFQWVRRLLVSSLGISCVVGMLSAALLLPTGGWLIPMWVGKPVAVSVPLLWALSTWNVLAVMGAAVAVFWNSLSLLRTQLVLSLLLALVSLPAKWWLGQRFGLTGIVWATNVSYVLVVAIPCLLIVPRQLAQLGRGHPAPTG